MPFGNETDRHLMCVFSVYLVQFSNVARKAVGASVNDVLDLSLRHIKFFSKREETNTVKESTLHDLAVTLGEDPFIYQTFPFASGKFCSYSHSHLLSLGTFRLSCFVAFSLTCPRSFLFDFESLCHYCYEYLLQYQHLSCYLRHRPARSNMSQTGFHR